MLEMAVANYVAPTPQKKAVSVSRTPASTLVITSNLFIFSNYYWCRHVNAGVVFGVSYSFIGS